MMSDDEATEHGRYKPENLPTAEDELWYIILRLVNESCGQQGGEEFDSWAIHAYEIAIEALHQAGFVEIDPSWGRIYAKKLPKARNFEAWIEGHEARRAGE